MNARLPVLSACMLVTLVLGSVHGFSVFLVPLQRSLELPRSQISLVYSLTLVSITLAVFFGHRWYARGPAWLLVATTCAISAAGLLLCSRLSGWGWLLFGYSLVFGLSNGFGYGYCLQLAGQVLDEAKGFAMGAVTATYAVGSVLFAELGGWRVAHESVESALLALALAVLGVGAAAALLLALAGTRFRAVPPARRAAPDHVERRRVLRYWGAYLTSVFAGLMAIGHAAGIALANGATTLLSSRAAVTIGVGSTLGGFVAGWLVDRIGSPRLLLGLPLISTLALVALAFVEQAPATVALLSLVGFSYGAVIAVYPVAIAREFGAAGPRVYGLVFTAWGFAGLFAPWSAGLIYDLTADYLPALILAAGVAAASAVLARRFRLGARA